MALPVCPLGIQLLQFDKMVFSFNRENSCSIVLLRILPTIYSESKNLGSAFKSQGDKNPKGLIAGL